MRNLFLLLIGVLMAPRLLDAQSPVIDAMSYPTDAAARAAWRPMSGTAPVSLVQLDGRPVLRLPCNFKGTKIDRASWDHPVNLDMCTCRGLRFRLLCRDISPIAHFVLYLQSGSGWYTATFAPSRTDGWNTILINKQDTRTEGTPAGWSAISTIRLSAWRGGDTDTELALADLEMVGGQADIAIIRADSAARTSPSEVQSISQFVQSMALNLDDLGLDYSVISDLDLTSARLKDVRLVILPHNPTMAAPATAALRSYLEQGGKLLACYTMPAELSTVTGIELGRHISQKSPGAFASIRLTDPPLPGAPAIVQQRSWNILDAKVAPARGRVLANWYDSSANPTGYPALIASDNCIFMTHVMLDDDPSGKRRLLVAMAGQLVPPLWSKAAQGAITRIGVMGPYTNWDQARQSIARQGGDRTSQTLVAADKARQDATALLAAGKFPQAMELAQESQRLTVEAYCLSQSPQPNEQRGFWCHSAFGPAGLTWDQSIKILADNGFNAIFPNMLWGGLAYYDSSVLPVSPEVKDKGDQIAACVAACRKYGVACHVWKVNWNMAGRAPRDFVQRMKQEGRTQVYFDGSPNDSWLCPSHPDNQKLEVAAMLEVASKYDVDGIHFDYIRYPDNNGCFCPGCRQRFEQRIGQKVPTWPADLRRNPQLSAQWLDFRRDNITQTVAAVSDSVRKIKPKLKISAAVFPNWSVDRDTVGQDWKLWCERGYVDFVCPMDYTPHNAEFANLIQPQKAWAGPTPCYPGIGLSTWGSSSENLIRLIEQINVTRQLGTHGFTLFEYQPAVAADLVPMCAKGITSRP